MKTMLPARSAAASASKAETLAMDRKKFPAAAICDRITRHFRLLAIRRRGRSSNTQNR
jgi:hypothetical protein